MSTKIEWCLNPDGSPGETWNPITGCLKGCEYCYARKLAETRLRSRMLGNNNIAEPDPDVDFDMGANGMFTNPFYPRFWQGRLDKFVHKGTYRPPRKRKGIFVCSLADLFGIGVPEAWTGKVLSAIWANPLHRFYLLTKQPQNLAKWSPFPGNCWVGVSVTNPGELVEAYNELICIDAKVKYVSLEPLLEWGDLYETYACRLPFLFGKADYPDNGIDWVIIGAQTKPTVMPNIDWVRDIVEAADKAGIPVFLKNSLKSLLPHQAPFYSTSYRPGGIDSELGRSVAISTLFRQEFPQGV